MTIHLKAHHSLYVIVGERADGTLITFDMSYERAAAVRLARKLRKQEQEQENEDKKRAPRAIRPEGNK